jgi:hypothetical protein
MKRPLDGLTNRGPEVLIAAGVLVGVAIALDGPVSKAVNGIAGVLWILAAVLLVRNSRQTAGSTRLFAATVVVGLVLVLAVRPSDLAWAAVGFAAGGAAVAVVATSARERAALLLPALWLPLHLLVAVIKAAIRAIRDQPASVRTDPPPTAALVPLAMIVAAYVGGWLVQTYLSRRHQRTVAAKPATRA